VPGDVPAAFVAPTQHFEAGQPDQCDDYLRMFEIYKENVSFDRSNVLGAGGQATVYKGTFADNDAAIKVSKAYVYYLRVGG
jgi:hypothetical protein